MANPNPKALAIQFGPLPVPVHPWIYKGSVSEFFEEIAQKSDAIEFAQQATALECESESMAYGDGSELQGG